MQNKDKDKQKKIIPFQSIGDFNGGKLLQVNRENCVKILAEEKSQKQKFIKQLNIQLLQKQSDLFFYRGKNQNEFDIVKLYFVKTSETLTFEYYLALLGELSKNQEFKSQQQKNNQKQKYQSSQNSINEDLISLSQKVYQKLLNKINQQQKHQYQINQQQKEQSGYFQNFQDSDFVKYNIDEFKFVERDQVTFEPLNFPICQNKNDNLFNSRCLYNQSTLINDIDDKITENSYEDKNFKRNQKIFQLLVILKHFIIKILAMDPKYKDSEQLILCINPQAKNFTFYYKETIIFFNDLHKKMYFQQNAFQLNPKDTYKKVLNGDVIDIIIMLPLSDKDKDQLVQKYKKQYQKFTECANKLKEDLNFLNCHIVADDQKNISKQEKEAMKKFIDVLRVNLEKTYQGNNQITELDIKELIYKENVKWIDNCVQQPYLLNKNNIVSEIGQYFRATEHKDDNHKIIKTIERNFMKYDDIMQKAQDDLLNYYQEMIRLIRSKYVRMPVIQIKCIDKHFPLDQSEYASNVCPKCGSEISWSNVVYDETYTQCIDWIQRNMEQNHIKEPELFFSKFAIFQDENLLIKCVFPDKIVNYGGQGFWIDYNKGTYTARPFLEADEEEENKILNNLQFSIEQDEEEEGGERASIVEGEERLWQNIQQQEQ